MKAIALIGVVTALAGAAACAGGDASDAPDIGALQQTAHGPVPNLLVRLVNGPGSEFVLCDARARGLAMTPNRSHKASLTLTYPSGGSFQKEGIVSLSAPSHVDGSDGEFAVTLVEKPPASGEYMVMASFKRATAERLAGPHHCDAEITEDTDGDTLFETQRLSGNGQAEHASTEPGAYRHAASHRQAGDHVVCRSRLNFPDPAATYFIDVTASAAGGPESATDVEMSPGSPLIGPLPLAGGDLFVEWATPPAPIPAPSLDVRFDFFGQGLGVPSACSVQITENDPSSPVVLDTSTTLVQNDTPDDVTVIDPWPSVPQVASPDSSFGTSFAISQGTNRLLLVAIMPAFDNTPSQTAVSATYGGKPLTPITVSDLSQRRVAWLGYLNESDIATRVDNTLQGSVQGPNLAGTCVYVSSYAGVNQTTPITASSNRYVNNANTPVALLSPLNYSAGGLGVFVFQVDNSANPPDSGGDGYVFSNGFQCGAGNYGRVSSKAMTSAGVTNISVDYGIIRAAVAGATLNPVP